MKFWIALIIAIVMGIGEIIATIYASQLHQYFSSISLIWIYSLLEWILLFCFITAFIICIYFLIKWKVEKMKYRKKQKEKYIFNELRKTQYTCIYLLKYCKSLEEELKKHLPNSKVQLSFTAQDNTTVEMHQFFNTFKKEELDLAYRNIEPLLQYFDKPNKK